MITLTDDFTNPMRFAGEQNITHIVNVALNYPLNGKDNYSAGNRLKMVSLCIGVDGCEGDGLLLLFQMENLGLRSFRLNMIEHICFLKVLYLES